VRLGGLRVCRLMLLRSKVRQDGGGWWAVWWIRLGGLRSVTRYPTSWNGVRGVSFTFISLPIVSVSADPRPHCHLVISSHYVSSSPHTNSLSLYFTQLLMVMVNRLHSARRNTRSATRIETISSLHDLSCGTLQR
jgi:hypothetical protein